MYIILNSTDIYLCDRYHRTRVLCSSFVFFFFFQAEDGIRDLVRSRGLGDVYKRQVPTGNKFRDLLPLQHYPGWYEWHKWQCRF